MTGAVKFYSAEKGFGFVKDDETGEEIFFSASGIDKNQSRHVKVPYLESGDKVEFDLSEGGERGPQARALKLTNASKSTNNLDRMKKIGCIRID